MNLPPSRGRDLVAMALNRELGEKMLARKLQFQATSEREEDDDPDFIPDSESYESDKSSEIENVELMEASDTVTCQQELTESVKVAKYVIEMLLDKVFMQFTTDGKKRKRRRFQTTIEQRKRQKTEEIIKKHYLKSPCNKKCKRKCTQKITPERREEINNLYWKMTAKERKTFMFNSTKKIVKSRSTTQSKESRRRFTIKYYYKTSEGNLEEICKIFFMSTLGFNKRNDKILRTVLQNTSTKSLQAVEDKRGRHVPSNKIDKGPVIEHINSFHPTISHYRREHAPKRKYLPSDINIHMMYMDFTKKNSDLQCSYEFYRRVVKELNISFVKLGHEECFTCESFSIHENNSEHKRDEFDQNCPNCQIYTNHIKKSDAARKCYQEDAAENVAGKSIYSADLQKVSYYPEF